jgi:hypothetical protein
MAERFAEVEDKFDDLCQEKEFKEKFKIYKMPEKSTQPSLIVHLGVYIYFPTMLSRVTLNCENEKDAEFGKCFVDAFTRSRDHMRKHLGESHVIGEGQGDVTKDNAEDELKGDSETLERREEDQKFENFQNVEKVEMSGTSVFGKLEQIKKFDVQSKFNGNKKFAKIHLLMTMVDGGERPDSDQVSRSLSYQLLFQLLRFFSQGRKFLRFIVVFYFILFLYAQSITKS